MKRLRVKHIDVYSMILSGLLYIGLGIIFLTYKEAVFLALKNILNLLIILFTIAAIFQILGFAPLRKKRLTSISRLVGFITNLLMAFIIYTNPKFVVSIFPILFGLYAFFGGIIRLLIYMQYKKNKVGKRFFIAIEALILMVVGTIIIIHPLASVLPLSNLIGMFFLLYGITFIVDAFLEGVSAETRASFKRRIRINLPVFMVVLIPHKILMKINKALESEKLNEEDLVSLKENGDFDLEVLIHVAESGVAAFGHVDIWFEGKVMTYGTYDQDTFKLAGIISDGVLIELSDKEQYIRFSQEHLGKTIFGFGLKLNESQKVRIREKIEDIHQNLVEWKPGSKIDEERGEIPEIPRKDYASIVYKNLKGDFYKFKKGPFKTYFALNTNCVLLADTIVGQAGIDFIKIQGLISPGAYFEFFNREYSRKNSFVISRTIYHKNILKERL